MEADLDIQHVTQTSGQLSGPQGSQCRNTHEHEVPCGVMSSTLQPRQSQEGPPATTTTQGPPQPMFSLPRVGLWFVQELSWDLAAAVEIA